MEVASVEQGTSLAAQRYIQGNNIAYAGDVTMANSLLSKTPTADKPAETAYLKSALNAAASNLQAGDAKAMSAVAMTNAAGSVITNNGSAASLQNYANVGSKVADFIGQTSLQAVSAIAAVAPTYASALKAAYPNSPIATDVGNMAVATAPSWASATSAAISYSTTRLKSYFQSF
jgi:hypothetical protein